MTPILVSVLLFVLGCLPAASAGTASSFVRGVPGSTSQEDWSLLFPPFDPSAVHIRLEPVVTGLREPTHLTIAHDGSGRFFVTERVGRIRIVRDGRLQDAPFLDVTSLVGSGGQEQGLLSVAFHPRYGENGWFYVNYTDRVGTTVIARYSVSADPDVANPGAALTLLRISQPAANHNGGLLLFGPDGYLYVGMGDGGGADDQFRNAQNLGALLGKLLRIDVDDGDPYAIPADNPFVGVPGALPEIWAYGIRNPWRFSFDRGTGELYIADVGQNQYEEVNIQVAGVGGQNYGWPVMEASHCFSSPTCDPLGLELPIAEYNHSRGCSVTGGNVYRGSAYPQVTGVYFFADFCSGRIWALDWSPDRGWRQTELLNSGRSISSFAEDEAGELFLTTLSPGNVYRVIFE